MTTTNQLRGILGENLVVNDLLYRGWIAMNLNTTINNAPNVDVIAIKESKKVSIQVKTSTLSQPIVQVGYGHKNPFLNNKKGPLADFIIFVRMENPKNYETYIVPVDIAEKEISNSYNIWSSTPKRDGTKRKAFPASIYFNLNKNRPEESNYIEKWKCYLDAWHLLE